MTLYFSERKKAPGKQGFRNKEMNECEKGIRGKDFSAMTTTCFLSDTRMLSSRFAQLAV
jgi:hypothetical protein